VNFKIIYGIIFFLTISTGTVFAQNNESLISVHTDSKNYDEGDMITISGNITTIIGETPVTLQIFTEGNLLEIAQIVVSQDGAYSHTIYAEGPLWKNQGEYIIKVSYGEKHAVETEFNYMPKSKIIETTNNFEVSIGEQGTFDIKYTIRGANLKDIKVNPDILGLIVEIEALEDGTILLDLPREFIGAEKQNGKDEVFIILIDGTEVSYKESITHSKSRLINIGFEPGDSKIEIIGTYVIPEFGAIAIIILTIGIITSILLTKNRFQMKN